MVIEFERGVIMQYLDKLGWPVERVKGRWFFNFVRLLIHTRKIKRGSFHHKVSSFSNDCGQETITEP